MVEKLKQAERRELWRQRVAQQERSGQTVRAFCREHKLQEHTFYTWRRQVGAAPETPVRFALVETTRPGTDAPPLSHQAPLELVLRSGEKLRIPGDAATLRLVLSVLREVGQSGT